MIPPFLLPLAATAALAGSPAPPAAMPPLIDKAPWVVTRVSHDGRTLTLLTSRGACDEPAHPQVLEGRRRVRIDLLYQPAAPGLPCTANVVFDTHRVRLLDPIGGRRLVRQTLRDVPYRDRVPHVDGLAERDRRFALRAHGFVPRCPER